MTVSVTVSVAVRWIRTDMDTELNTKDETENSILNGMETLKAMNASISRRVLWLDLEPVGHLMSSSSI